MSITELPNSLTVSLDASTGEGIARILRTSDAQIFAGYDIYPSLADASIRNALERGACAAAQVLKHPKGIVVISGSGTSGRLAFMISTMLNTAVRNNTGHQGIGPFYYCNSGGDSALLLPSELAEDNTTKGVGDLQEVIQRADAVGAPVMVIGVTCGMSAPYVAGQLDYALTQISKNEVSMADFTTCLIGFNPISLARNIPIEMWSERSEQESHTFRDIAYAMEAGVSKDNEKDSDGNYLKIPKHVLINPVVGPESLCGSTRMKGGSATKICLETMLSLALHQVHGNKMIVPVSLPSIPSKQPTELMTVENILSSYYEAYTTSYSSTKTLGVAIETVGESLKSSGKVYYIGCGVAATVGFIDASEMRPTFGAPASETRAFATNGWSSIGNIEGNLSNNGPLYRIDFDNFNTDVLPLLNTNDVVVALHCPNEIRQETNKVDQLALNAKEKSGCKIICLNVTRSRNEGQDKQEENQHEEKSTSEKTTEQDVIAKYNVYVNVQTKTKDGIDLLLGYDGYSAFVLKIVLNAVSTGGQALAGRVLSNRMINVTPSNHKLFLRCTGLVSLLAGGMNETKARRCLLRAIYATDDVTKIDELLLHPVSDFIKAAGAAGSITKSNKLLPVAILLASGKCNTVENAREVLKEYTTVREALFSLK